MAFRPRPSLLALFDPLTISETSQVMTTRDTHSPAPSSGSGSDKENVTSTTPKGSFNSGACNTQADLLGSSISSVCLESTGDDSLNLCLVPLADELDSACKITDADDIILQRSQGPREPLSEISLIPSNGNDRTPQSVARDKRLINLDSPCNSTTPKSLRKFTAGIDKYEPSTPCASPLASHGPPRTPRNLDSTDVKANKQASPDRAADKLYLAPSIPFTSNSPSLLSSTPASDPHPVFHDPPSSHFGSSFEINDPSCMKRMNLTGDLLKDDLSFLKQLEDDSFADPGRGNSTGDSTDRTTNSSPKAPQETSDGALSEKKSGLLHGTRGVVQDEGRRRTKVETPARKASTVFRRPSSVSGLVFGSKREEFFTALSSPTGLEPRTPSSSPSSKNDTRGQALAPKKSQTVIRHHATLSRSVSTRIASPVKEEESVDDHEGTRNTKKGILRPRPSSMEIKLITRTQSFSVKQGSKAATPNKVLSTVGRGESVSRPTLGRRASVGRGLSPTRPKASDFTQDQTQKPSQGHPSQRIRPVPVPGRRVSTGRALSPVRPKMSDFKLDPTQKPSTTPLAASNRRLSISTSSKPTPVKTNVFATTGRLGGARRVPLTANAPLFKANDLTNKAVQSPKPIPRTESKTGPQRPLALSGTSRTLGRSTSGPNVSSPKKTSTPSVATTKTLGRAASASSAVSSRSSFMTTSASSVASSSRLPTLPTKSSNRLPGLGARKAFK